jgi:hypothetical protein
MNSAIFVRQQEEIMKKYGYLALIPFLVVSLYCKKDKNIQREGIINFLTGTVTIIDKDKKVKAQVGDMVSQGMRIETGNKSFVDIYFDDNAVKILENSIVEISELEINVNENSEKTRFHIKQGKIFAKVAKKLAKNDRFLVSSPTATAGVRGTEFLVIEDGGTGVVATLKGKVEVKNEASPDQGAVIVPDKKEVVVEKDKEMTVRDLSAENRVLMENIMKNFQDMKKEIRERFEKKREEIRKAVEDQRQRNLESVEKQKKMDLENVERQKALDKANVDKLKVISDKTATDAQEGVQKQQQESQEKLEGVKPTIKKFKSTIE